jgi:DNA-binding IclR family transcriptional regulator
MSLNRQSVEWQRVRVLNALRATNQSFPVAVKQLVEQLGLSDSRVRELLDSLVGEELVVAALHLNRSRRFYITLKGVEYVNRTN